MNHFFQGRVARLIKRNLTILAMILVLILGVSGLSVVYGFWVSSVSVNSTLQTGSFVQQFSYVSVLSSSETAKCTASIKTGDSKIPLIELNISNAFPGVSCTVTFEIKNNGSIPAAIQKITFGRDAVDSFSTLAWGGAKPACGEVLAVGASRSYQFVYSLPLSANLPQSTTFHSTLEFHFTQFNAFDPAACTIIAALP